MLRELDHLAPAASRFAADDLSHRADHGSSVVRAAIDLEDDVRFGERLWVGRVARFGIATTRMPAAFAERMPLCESSTASASFWRDAEPQRRFEVDVGRGLAPRHLLGRHGRAEEPGEPGELEHGVDQRPVRRRRDREREDRRHALHAPLARPARAAVLAVAGPHQLDDVGVDLGRRSRVDAELLVDEARPLRRAHAHHRPLRLGVVAAAPLADVPLAHVVPDLLALDEHAVEVEDDRLDDSHASCAE